MTEKKGYKNLIAWQKSVDLVTQTYILSKSFPKEELYGLTSQIRRAAVSISSNLAEGYGRSSRKEYIYFISIAIGSATELETLFIIASKLQLVNGDAYDVLDKNLQELLKILFKLRSSLQKSA